MSIDHLNIERRIVSEENRGGQNLGRKYIIMHGTGLGVNSTADNEIAYLIRPGAGVSYHYYITKTGRVIHMVEDHERAWHAGSSKWGADRNLNNLSIGVALESHNGITEHYPTEQITAARDLVTHLMRTHDIKADNVLSHREVSDPQGRKIDPVNFDMNKFRDLLRDKADATGDAIHLDAYHPDTNEHLGKVTLVAGTKVYPHWLKGS